MSTENEANLFDSLSRTSTSRSARVQERHHRGRGEAADGLRLSRPDALVAVAGTLMVEPTESESKYEIDHFCDAMIL